jgi:DNA-directed RNA polymerase subunit K/omega
MKLETLAFQEILKLSNSVFEAVNVLGRRVRQINARQAAETAILREEVFEDEFAITPTVDEERMKETVKPVVQAMDDFLHKRLEWHYAERVDAETEEDRDMESPEL